MCNHRQEHSRIAFKTVQVSFVHVSPEDSLKMDRVRVLVMSERMPLSAYLRSLDISWSSLGRRVRKALTVFWIRGCGAYRLRSTKAIQSDIISSRSVVFIPFLSF